MRKNILAIATIGMLLLSSLMIMPTVGAIDDGPIIEAPSEANEMEDFVVRVVDSANPSYYYANAEITVGWNDETYYTGFNGEVVLLSPEVNQNTDYTITADVGAYDPVSVWITVLNINDNNILYVGGDDPGNYTKIQDAINASSNGDTVFVYNGTYCENVIVNKSINLVGEDRNTTLIDGKESGIVVNVTANETCLSDFTLINNSKHDHALVVDTDFNVIKNNKIIFRPTGLPYNAFSLYYADNNEILDNMIVGGGKLFGLRMYDSNNNTIKGNTIIDGYGISISDNSRNNTFRNNELFNCTVLVGLDFNNDIDTSNTVNGKPIYCCIDKNNLIINDAGLVILINCSDCVISDCHITTSGFHGILLINSDNNIISDCTFANTKEYFPAINLVFSDNNEMIRNTIENCFAGFDISESYNNFVYHNNFINNTCNAYDYSNNNWNSSFMEGNYYSDFDNSTEGAYDNNSDGIVDTPYNISGGDNKDYYPLMEPWVEPAEDITPPTIEIIKPEKALYINNEKKGQTRLVRMALIIGDITIEVNATDNESGIKQVNFTIDPFRPFAKQVFNDTTAPYTYNWTRGRIRFFHIHVLKIEVIDNAGNIAEERMVVRRIL